jgi:hypothetical protein
MRKCFEKYFAFIALQVFESLNFKNFMNIFNFPKSSNPVKNFPYPPTPYFPSTNSIEMNLLKIGETVFSKYSVSIKHTSSEYA